MIFLDAAIAILLALTIVYLWRLNKRIGDLKGSKTEFAKLIQYFDDAIIRAEMGIEELKTLASHNLEELRSKAEKAKFLGDDLAFMTDRASELADKLEEKIGEARKAEKSLSIKVQSSTPQRNSMYNPVTGAQFEPRFDETPKVISKPTQDTESRKKSIQSLLERISSANNKDQMKKELIYEE